MNSIKNKINFLRAHLIARRQLSMLGHVRRQSFVKPSRSILKSSKKINEVGYCNGPTIPEEILREILSIYENRISEVVPKATGAPFKNLMKPEDISIDNPIVKLAFSKEILDPAMDYFGDKIYFESLQVLYSYPSIGKLRESQHWHKDFGDSKSFHAVVYLNDVHDPSQGPFVFVNKSDSKRMKKSLLIRRIPDEVFKEELGDGEVKYFYGNAGTSVFVDPAKCYHYGSRCEKGRLAIFITFNTSTPYMIVPSLTSKYKEKLFEIGTHLRPDISFDKLRNLLRVKN